MIKAIHQGHPVWVERSVRMLGSNRLDVWVHYQDGHKVPFVRYQTPTINCPFDCVPASELQDVTYTPDEECGCVHFPDGTSAIRCSECRDGDLYALILSEIENPQGGSL